MPMQNSTELIWKSWGVQTQNLGHLWPRVFLLVNLLSIVLVFSWVLRFPGCFVPELLFLNLAFHLQVLLFCFSPDPISWWDFPVRFLFDFLSFVSFILVWLFFRDFHILIAFILSTVYVLQPSFRHSYFWVPRIFIIAISKALSCISAELFFSGNIIMGCLFLEDIYLSSSCCLCHAVWS